MREHKEFLYNFGKNNKEIQKYCLDSNVIQNENFFFVVKENLIDDILDSINSENRSQKEE